MKQRTSIAIRVRVGGADGPVVIAFGREAWALLILIEASSIGCLPEEHPAPRWSAYVYDLRKLGFSIDTLLEPHGGPFPGRHARYVLRSRVTVLEKLGAAA